MAILWTVIIGFVIGAIAKLLMPVLLGIAGSFFAGMAGRAMHWYSEGQPAGFIVSVVGAVLLLTLTVEQLRR